MKFPFNCFFISNCFEWFQKPDEEFGVAEIEYPLVAETLTEYNYHRGRISHSGDTFEPNFKSGPMALKQLQEPSTSSTMAEQTQGSSSQLKQSFMKPHHSSKPTLAAGPSYSENQQPKQSFTKPCHSSKPTLAAGPSYSENQQPKQSSTKPGHSSKPNPHAGPSYSENQQPKQSSTKPCHSSKPTLAAGPSYSENQQPKQSFTKPGHSSKPNPFAGPSYSENQQPKQSSTKPCHSSKPTLAAGPSYSENQQPKQSSTKPGHSSKPNSHAGPSYTENQQPKQSSTKPGHSSKPNQSSGPSYSESQPPKQSSTKPEPDRYSKQNRSADSSYSKNQQGRRKYVVRDNPTYKIPKDIEELLEKGIVPQVLKMPLSQSTYKDYYATLLYAEDFYIEKWADFRLEDVTLNLEDAEIYDKRHKHINRNKLEGKGGNNKIIVKLKIGCKPNDQPFLLSRDFVSAQLSGSNGKLFEGVIYRVMKSNIVLAEFGDDFRSQHKPTRKYNVSFSFNRVCLKRAHKAIESASDSLFKDFIFPSDFTSRKHFSPSLLFPCKFDLDQSQRNAVAAILSINSAPPYLIEENGGPYMGSFRLRSVVEESVLQIYRSASPKCRILICAPTNRTCDDLIQALKSEIPESNMFRANAAFREKEIVPDDILSSCRYKEDSGCFICPPLDELLKFQIIFSTFISSIRLRDEGIPSGYFSHIFLVDASIAIEPEALVPLASLANTNTAVVVMGKSGQRSSWVRSDIGRRYGLKMSYFERLQMSQLYNGKNLEFVKIV